MVQVRTVMTKNVITVTPETPAHSAVEILVENKVSGLPVVDAYHRLVGVITEKDVLQLLSDVESGQQPVAEFMTRKITSFEDEASLMDVCKCLMANSFRRVPILRDEKLVGVVSRRDIIRYIVELRKKLNQA